MDDFFFHNTGPLNLFFFPDLHGWIRAGCKCLSLLQAQTQKQVELERLRWSLSLPIAESVIILCIIRYLQNPNQRLRVPKRFASYCFQSLTSLLCFFSLHRAEKTEVLSDDLLQVNIPHMQDCTAPAFKHLHFAWEKEQVELTHWKTCGGRGVNVARHLLKMSRPQSTLRVFRQTSVWSTHSYWADQPAVGSFVSIRANTTHLHFALWKRRWADFKTMKTMTLCDTLFAFVLFFLV